MTDHGDFNGKIIEEFRANAGKVGGWFEGQSLLLLHHTGIKTGTKRINPLVYQQVGDCYAIFASAGGAPADPQWYRNLMAHPDTSVEVGGDTVQVRAREVTGSDRDPIWSRQKAARPNFAEYEVSAAPRTIPVVLLDPVP